MYAKDAASVPYSVTELPSSSGFHLIYLRKLLHIMCCGHQLVLCKHWDGNMILSLCELFLMSWNAFVKGVVRKKQVEKWYRPAEYCTLYTFECVMLYDWRLLMVILFLQNAFSRFPCAFILMCVNKSAHTGILDLYLCYSWYVIVICIVKWFFLSLRFYSLNG